MAKLSEKYHQLFIRRSSAILEKEVAKYKPHLFAGMSGKVVEIGPGTGVNLKYFDNKITWIGVEPNAELRKNIESQPLRPKNISFVVPNHDDSLSFEQGTIDHVIGTFVLCSVSNPMQMLRSIHRILKPGGTYRFMEHIAAPSRSLQRQVQNIITPFTRLIAGNCHANRQTDVDITRTGFSSVQMKRFNVSMKLTVYPCIYGTATK